MPKATSKNKVIYHIFLRIFTGKMHINRTIFYVKNITGSYPDCNQNWSKVFFDQCYVLLKPLRHLKVDKIAYSPIGYICLKLLERFSMAFFKMPFF